jgi:hypothetical protein
VASPSYEIWKKVEVLVLVVVEVVVLRAERHDSLGAIAGLEATRVDVGGVDLGLEAVEAADDAGAALDLCLLSRRSGEAPSRRHG